MADAGAGWDENGTPDMEPTIERCLRRAAWAAQAAYKGRKSKDGTGVPTGERHSTAVQSLAYSNLAIALQNERDYEQREIQRIATLAKGGEDAEMRPDEPDGVRDRVELEHEELSGEDLPPGRGTAHL